MKTINKPSNNWYKQAKLEQTSGKLSNSILLAVMAVIGGMSFDKASEKYQVPIEEIRNNIENRGITIPFSSSDYEKEFSQNKNMDVQKETTKELSREDKIKENIIARTIYAEGKGESLEGKKAIASVIFNRGNGNIDSIIAVIKKPKQFSCWNSAGESDWNNMKQKSGNSWEESMQIAKSIMNGTFQSSGNWNHYYNPKLCSPSWAYENGKIKEHIDIGNHRFLKF
jgi:N-acetylmuramoyl-L-alanine amidase